MAKLLHPDTGKIVAPRQSTVGLAQTRARLLLPFLLQPGYAAQATGPSATALSLVAWLPWHLEEDTTNVNPFSLALMNTGGMSATASLRQRGHLGTTWACLLLPTPKAIAWHCPTARLLLPNSTWAGHYDTTAKCGHLRHGLLPAHTWWSMAPPTRSPGVSLLQPLLTWAGR